VCLCERPCGCPCVCVSLCLGMCSCVCVPVFVRVTVCYNNGNFWEILHSAHPSGSKRELRVTSFATYGFYVLHIFVTYALIPFVPP
jgi:hypothetical protein